MILCYDDVSAITKYLSCLEQSLASLCGVDAAAWQRDNTMKMILPTALDRNCITKAFPSVALLFSVMTRIKLRFKGPKAQNILWGPITHTT